MVDHAVRPGCGDEACRRGDGRAERHADRRGNVRRDVCGDRGGNIRGDRRGDDARAAGGAKIVLIAINLTFDKTDLTAPVGAVTFELDNQDPGQPHNIHIFKGADVSGESIGSSPLNVGPTKDLLDVTLEKGEYFFQCDVHPTTMLGKITAG